jgi:hypothetical protein
MARAASDFSDDAESASAFSERVEQRSIARSDLA